MTYTNDIGFPFQGRAWYWVESSFGGGLSGVTLPISCYIQDVRIGSGDRHKPIRDISAAQVKELMELADEPTLHIEYNPQVGDTLVDDAVDRTSCCTLQSMAFLVEANKCMPANDDSEFYIVGAKANTIRISGSKHEPWTVAIDFLCKSVVTTAPTASVAPAPLAGAILTYNLAGSITKTGGVSAFVTNAVDITINQNLTSYIDIGGANPEYIVEGAMDITGTCDITLDGGGSFHFAEVLSNTPFTLALAMDGAGAILVTIPGCEWDSAETDKNVSGEAMIEGAPFTAAPISCVTDTSCVTTIITNVGA